VTVYDKTLPAGTKAANLLDDDTRFNFTAIEERLAKEHQFPDNSDATRQGKHKFGTGTTAQRNAAYPTPYAGAFWAWNSDIKSPEVGDGTTWQRVTPATTLLIGEIKPWSDADVAQIPANWFLCNGQELLIVSYPSLYARCGGSANHYGVPIDPAKFKVPDLGGRSPIGYIQTGDADYFRPGLATASTAKTRTLAIANMPAHSHGGVSGPQVGMTVNTIQSGTVGTGGGANGTAIGTNAHTHTVASEGSGTPLDIRHPYLTLGFIIWSGGVGA
jgi:microcystin-dependent protein